MKMTRRHFLQTVVITGLSTAINTTGNEKVQIKSILLTREQALLEHIYEAEAASKFGMAYLNIYKSERTPEDLLAKLPSVDGAERLTNRLDEQIRADYDDSSMCCLDGWFLSLTEGRLYALFVLAG